MLNWPPWGLHGAGAVARRSVDGRDRVQGGRRRLRAGQYGVRHDSGKSDRRVVVHACADRLLPPGPRRGQGRERGRDPLHRPFRRARVRQRLAPVELGAGRVPGTALQARLSLPIRACSGSCRPPSTTSRGRAPPISVTASAGRRAVVLGVSLHADLRVTGARFTRRPAGAVVCADPAGCRDRPPGHLRTRTRPSRSTRGAPRSTPAGSCACRTRLRRCGLSAPGSSVSAASTPIARSCPTGIETALSFIGG